ncbi:uncharacterized protein LOC142896434 [Nelusetta ayraudi]|uniref:uncharacterized protein LOC142896434 n=1 Tax=Nelusetta ayraudi TaxID=303726 RepID=UPI003F72DE0D
MAAAADVDQLQFKKKINRRGHLETIFLGHRKLSDLKTKARDLENGYLFKGDIPRYPQPKFCVSLLKHDTDSDGLRGIWKDKGFRNPFNASLVWWSLAVGQNEITAAATSRMMTNLTDELVQVRADDLKEFATSPAFMESSRLGPYRFTFPVEKVLQAYSKQFCDGEEPIMRAFRTYLYKQEVMYVVLVHRPCDEELFLDYDLLTDTPNPVCAYKDGRIIWRAQAMCNAHYWALVESGEQLMEAVEEYLAPFYVWDNVSVALHVGDQVLTFDDNDLCNSLKFCSKGYPLICKTFDQPKTCEALVKELWPSCPALQESAEVEEPAQLLENSNMGAANA